MPKHPLNLLSVIAAFVFLVFAQSQAVQDIDKKIASPTTIQTQPQTTQPGIARTQEMEIEALKKQISKLQDQNKKLSEQNEKLTAQIAEMTKKGGSQVKAYCEGYAISKNTAGVSNNCATAGYICEPVSGLCYNQCTSSLHCASGFACKTEQRICVRVLSY